VKLPSSSHSISSRCSHGDHGGALAQLHAEVAQLRQRLLTMDAKTTQLTQDLKKCRKNFWAKQLEYSTCKKQLSCILIARKNEVPSELQSQESQLEWDEQALAEELCRACSESKQWSSVVKRQDIILKGEQQLEESSGPQSTIVKHPAGEVFVAQKHLMHAGEACFSQGSQISPCEVDGLESVDSENSIEEVSPTSESDEQGKDLEDVSMIAVADGAHVCSASTAVKSTTEIPEVAMEEKSFCSSETPTYNQNATDTSQHQHENSKVDSANAAKVQEQPTQRKVDSGEPCINAVVSHAINCPPANQLQERSPSNKKTCAADELRVVSMTLKSLKKVLTSRERQICELSSQLSMCKSLYSQCCSHAESWVNMLQLASSNSEPEGLHNVYATVVSERKAVISKLAARLEYVQNQGASFRKLAHQQRSFFCQNEAISLYGGKAVLSSHPAGDVFFSKCPQPAPDDFKEWDVGKVYANPYVCDSWPFKPNVLSQRAPQEAPMQPFAEETEEDLEDALLLMASHELDSEGGDFATLKGRWTRSPTGCSDFAVPSAQGTLITMCLPGEVEDHTCVEVQASNEALKLDTTSDAPSVMECSS